jgi:ABC-2 type transport system permease protein
MFNQVYAIAVKEIKVALRDHGLLPLLLLMPAMFMLILSMGGGAAAPRRMEIAAVNEDQGEVAARIVQRIRQDTAFSLRDAANGAPMSRLAAEEQLKNRESGPLLVVEFPADFSQRLSSQTPASIAFAEAPTDGAAAIHAGEERVKMLAASEVSSWQSLRVGQNALDTLAAQAAAAGQKDFANVNQEFARAIAQEGNATPPALVFQQVSADQGNGSKTPGRAEHNVPAYTIFGIFFIVQVIATSLLREREGGTFQRLHTAPVARAVLLLGKLLPFYLINTVQAAILLGLGHLFFHVSLGTSLSALLLMTLGTVAAANALGLFVAAIAKTQEQMVPMAAVILLGMAAGGGLFVSVARMPHFLQALAWTNPDAMALRGFEAIVLHGSGVSAILPYAAILFAYALFTYGIGVWKFRMD